MIALDSSAIICFVENHQPAARTISEHVLVDERRIVVSVLALTECLVGPLNASDRELCDRYRDFFCQGVVQVRDVNNDVAERAATLRVAFGLKVVDAIHLATAIEAGANAFVSADQKDFTRCVGRLDLDVLIVPRSPDPR